MDDGDVDRNRARKAATVEEVYPVSPVVEGMVAAAVLGRRVGRRMVGKMRRQ